MTDTKRYVPVKLTLSVTNQEMPDVDLAWDNLESLYGIDVVSYVVYRTTDRYAGFTAVSTSLSGTTAAWADSTVVANTTYWYKVLATVLTSGSIAQVWSNEAEATPFVAGLTTILIGRGLGAFTGWYAINQSTYALTAPGAGEYYNNASPGNPANVQPSSIVYENGYLHTGGFFSRAYWWVLKLSDWTRTKVWTFVAGPYPPCGVYGTGHDGVLCDMGGGASVTRTLNAARDTVDSYTISSSYGAMTSVNDATAGQYAVNSQGKGYWVGSSAVNRRTIFPASIDDAEAIKTGIVSVMEYSHAAIALYQDGAYVLVLQRDSADAAKKGCWLHVIKASSGAVASLDLNTTTNTLHNEHLPWSISVKDTLAFITRLDGSYVDGVVGTRRDVFIIDLANPDVPVLANTLTSSTNGVTGVRRVVVKGNYLYYVRSRHYNTGFTDAYSASWHVWRITNPYVPVELIAEDVPEIVSMATLDGGGAWCWSLDDEAVDGGNKGPWATAV